MFAALVTVTGSVVVSAQNEDLNPPFGRRNHKDEDRPRAIEERLVKMRIEREKKDHNEMVARGEELHQIVNELEKSFATNGRLSDADLSNLTAAEKLAKKIRSDLGGSNDDEEDVKPGEGNKPFSLSDAVKAIQTTSEKLFGELKKSTRFTISVPAIQSANAVIRLARFLRVAP